ncbi:hypothetical protein ACP70R_023578 [Stipagrostis hirtigluma subsp. patula]
MAHKNTLWRQKAHQDTQAGELLWMQGLCGPALGPFDEAILVWHLATDICFYEGACAVADHHHKTAILFRGISNCMVLVYLLVVHPDMLMAGTRTSFRKCSRVRSCRQMKETLQGRCTERSNG